MKKINILLSAVLLLAGIFIISNKLYIPQSPIDHLSAKGILQTLNNSNEEVVKLTKENNQTWYITKSNNNGIVGADSKIVEMLATEGWTFKDKDGSGLFFEKHSEKIIVTTEMWTSKYVLVKVPVYQ